LATRTAQLGKKSEEFKTQLEEIIADSKDPQAAEQFNKMRTVRKEIDGADVLFARAKAGIQANSALKTRDWRKLMVPLGTVVLDTFDPQVVGNMTVYKNQSGQTAFFTSKDILRPQIEEMADQLKQLLDCVDSADRVRSTAAAWEQAVKDGLQI
jgi:hypothetical protein